MATLPDPSFTTSPSVPPALSQPLASYLATDPTLDGLATGALVFWPAASSAAAAAAGNAPRILLLQRAAHDSMPLLWETPGGAADADDASIATAAARELREEAGLVARRVRAVVGDPAGFAFRTRAGRRLRKVSFLVEVEADQADQAEKAHEPPTPLVRLDPEEHVAFVWASEAECRAGRVAGDANDGGLAIPFTHADQEAVVFAGFRAWEQLVRDGEGEEVKRLG